MFLVLYSYSVITVHSLDFVWKSFSTLGKKYMEIVFHFPDFLHTGCGVQNICDDITKR